MTARQTAILNALQSVGSFGVTSRGIAAIVNAPEASVRRTIQELIRLGHNVSFAADGLYYYRKGY